MLLGTGAFPAAACAVAPMPACKVQEFGAVSLAFTLLGTGGPLYRSVIEGLQSSNRFSDTPGLAPSSTPPAPGAGTGSQLVGSDMVKRLPDFGGAARGVGHVPFVTPSGGENLSVRRRCVISRCHAWRVAAMLNETERQTECRLDALKPLCPRPPPPLAPVAAGREAGIALP